MSQHLNSIRPANVHSVEVLMEPDSFILGSKGVGVAIITTSKESPELFKSVGKDHLTLSPLGDIKYLNHFIVRVMTLLRN